MPRRRGRARSRQSPSRFVLRVRLRTARCLSPTAKRRAGTGHALVALQLRKLTRGDEASAQERTGCHSDKAGRERADCALRRAYRRVGFRRCRGGMNLYNLEHGHTERDAFLCTSNARRADTNWPHVGNFVEMSGGAPRVCVGSLAAHLIQTPSFAVALVAVLFYEPAGIEVRSSRALIMNVAVKRELGAPFLIEFRQRARVGKLQDYPEQRVGIGWTSRDVYDRLMRQEISDAYRTRWIRIGRGNSSPGSAGADGDYRGSLSRHVGEDLHGWPPGQLHIDALIPSGDRALNDADVLGGAIVHGLHERFLGLRSRTRHQRLGVFGRDDVPNQIVQARVGSPQKRLGAAGAVLKCKPDHGRAND